MARKPAPDTRQRILDVASRLFSLHGVRAIGLQQVISETGLGKSLLYREFASKDDLVAAWLQQGRANWWTAVEQISTPHDGDPVRQLILIMEMASRTVAEPEFAGCIFHNTSTEFRDPTHPGRQESVAHLTQIRDHFETLAAGAGADDPRTLADSLMLVLDGLYSSGSVHGIDGPARLAVPIAETLIQKHLQQD
jgi:AcrR family transcriptional regulator